MEQITKALSVALEDRPGTLFKASDAIAKAGINIEGFCAVPAGKEGMLHVVTTDPKGTRKALEGVGFKVKDELDALVIDIQDRPGALAGILRPIADAEVNLAMTFSLIGNRIAFIGRDVAQLRDIVRQAVPVTARS